jgi:subtilisin family serine protease
MKVVVHKYLNVRVGQPSINAPCYQYIAPGSELEVDGQLYQGDMCEGVDTWMKDAAGNYYWSGGLLNEPVTARIIPTAPADVAAFTALARNPPSFIDWNASLAKLPASLRAQGGAGIKVGVLDTGVEKTHIDLSRALLFSKDYTAAVSGDLDVSGHGTEMISLIASNPFRSGTGVRGVAPNASILSAKVIYDANDPGDLDSVSDALADMNNQQADIISMSLGWKQSFDNVVTAIASIKNAVLFVAGNEYQGCAAGDLLKLFPASMPAVIPVCTVSRDYLLQNSASLPTSMIVVPDYQAWCCSTRYRKYYALDSGSSVATALMAGVGALLLSSDKSIPRTRAGMLAALGAYASTPDEAFSNPGQFHFMIR